MSNNVMMLSLTDDPVMTGSKSRSGDMLVVTKQFEIFKPRRGGIIYIREKHPFAYFTAYLHCQPHTDSLTVK